MKTYEAKIISPFQTMQKNPKHPLREEIEKCVGTYNLTAVVEEDIQTQSTMSHINGLISFLCTLLKDGKVVSQGRGSSVLNPSNRFLQRAVASAFNSALADSAIRATKVLDTFRTLGEPAFSKTLKEAYEAKESVSELATDKQKSYLRELVQINIEDEKERSHWESQISELSRSEASGMIQGFLK